MLHQCDKCGATTRWYDEKCPSCGAARTVEIPTAPISLPRFAPSSTRTNEEIDAARPALTPRPETVSPEKTPETQKAESPQDATLAPPTEEAEEVQETTTPPTEETEEVQETTTPRTKRFEVLRRAVDVWRSVFSAETASVTVPRGRVVRYALGIVAELVLCFPCALLAAYFFTGALLADRRAQYHAAMQKTEKARRTLLVGLGVFAAFLCAFIFYVQSQEIAAPKDPGPASLLFKK
jgi:predicted  nucleic acid-binding Zn-ribbon protein